MRMIEWIVDAILWVAVASDTRSADPAIAARKRASFGMFCSLVATALLCLLSLGFAQTLRTNMGGLVIAAPVMELTAVGFAALACVASLVGIGYVVRYVLVVTWPERFLDLCE
jgi:hypothetical protein